MSSDPVKVFVSYSHDSEKHMACVLALANRLRKEGVDAELDQYEPAPSKGWPLWVQERLEWADFVLVIATETYHRRFNGQEKPGQGLGVNWEGAILRQQLYETAGKNSKFIPVVFCSDDRQHIPTPLRGVNCYLCAEGGYDDLYRRITNQPGIVRPPLGKVRSLPPRGEVRPMPERPQLTRFKPIPPDGLLGSRRVRLLFLVFLLAVAVLVLPIWRGPRVTLWSVQSGHASDWSYEPADGKGRAARAPVPASSGPGVNLPFDFGQTTTEYPRATFSLDSVEWSDLPILVVEAESSVPRALAMAVSFMKLDGRWYELGIFEKLREEMAEVEFDLRRAKYKTEISFSNYDQAPPQLTEIVRLNLILVTNEPPVRFPEVEGKIRLESISLRAERARDSLLVKWLSRFFGEGG